MKTKLCDVEWKEFKLQTIFQLENCRCSNVSKLSAGTVPYIGATNRNNGVLGYLKPYPNLITKGNCMVFICDGEGSIGYSIYKSEDFIGSTTLKVGRNERLNRYNALFITSVADKVRGKYNFGFKRNEKHLKKETLLLPVTMDGQPDYSFMEAYMREKERDLVKKYKDYISQFIDSEIIKQGKVKPLAEKNWMGFSIEVIADIISGQDIYEAERISGKRPYISSTALNNGIGYFVDNTNKSLEAGSLSVNRNGSVGYSFYHPYSALFSNDCRKLRLKNPSKFVGIFIANQITLQRGKYGYGYKMGTGRLKRQKIMLPVDLDSNPDYEYMEQYMRQLEQKNLLQYLEYVESQSENSICDA